MVNLKSCRAVFLQGILAAVDYKKSHVCAGREYVAALLAGTECDTVGLKLVGTEVDQTIVGRAEAGILIVAVGRCLTVLYFGFGLVDHACKLSAVLPVVALVLAFIVA